MALLGGLKTELITERDMVGKIANALKGYRSLIVPAGGSTEGTAGTTVYSDNAIETKYSDRRRLEKEKN